MLRWVSIVAAIPLVAAVAFPAFAQETSVTYRLYHYEGGAWAEKFPNDPFPPGGDQPGSNLWRYQYELCNYSFSTGVRELNMFFNSDNVLCATFQSSAQPANWTGTSVGPFAPDNNWRIRYRTLVTASRVAQGACVDLFTLDFLWACPTLPGSQNYDAISASGSDAGQSTPNGPVPVEPATWGRLKNLY